MKYVFIIGTLQVVWNDSGSYHFHILLNVLRVGHSLPTCQLWKHPLYFSPNFLCSEAILPIAHVFLRIISKSTSMFLSLYLHIISWLLTIPEHLIKFEKLISLFILLPTAFYFVLSKYHSFFFFFTPLPQLTMNCTICSGFVPDLLYCY